MNSASAYPSSIIFSSNPSSASLTCGMPTTAIFFGTEATGADSVLIHRYPAAIAITSTTSASPAQSRRDAPLEPIAAASGCGSGVFITVGSFVGDTRTWYLAHADDMRVPVYSVYRRVCGRDMTKVV